MQLDTIEGFRKVLSTLSKEELVDVSGNFNLPTSGKKEKLVEIISKNLAELKANKVSQKKMVN